MKNSIEKLFNYEQKKVYICKLKLTGGLLLKKLKYFKVTLNIFEFSQAWENVEFWLVYAIELFWIAQPYFSNDIIKQS